MGESHPPIQSSGQSLLRLQTLALSHWTGSTARTKTQGAKSKKSWPAIDKSSNKHHSFSILRDLYGRRVARVTSKPNDKRASIQSLSPFSFVWFWNSPAFFFFFLIYFLWEHGNVSFCAGFENVSFPFLHLLHMCHNMTWMKLIELSRKASSRITQTAFSGLILIFVILGCGRF